MLIIDIMMRERQQKIVEFINRVGIASFADLAQLHRVSPFTIRRDVDYLAQSRLLSKIKGGAQRIKTPSQFREARLPNRMRINLNQKERIAEKALELIQPGDTIFLDGSSTIACLAR
ncbi:MAG: DeoR/GlpR transcriptional regulator, partial [Sedimentisphaerales bacterium]|nr:DeoR/GlpR transcriptional regulator [Sedimentisphaerales bacterium]